MEAVWKPTFRVSDGLPLSAAKKRDKAAASAVWGIKYLFCLIKSI